MTAERRDYVKRSLFSWRAHPAVTRADVMWNKDLIFFFFLVWWQEEDGGWAGWGMLVVFSKTGWPWLVRRLVWFGRAIQEWLLPA